MKRSLLPASTGDQNFVKNELFLVFLPNLLPLASFSFCLDAKIMPHSEPVEIEQLLG
jgi:hypothetical protein